MLEIPHCKTPIQNIEYEGFSINIKREDTIHPEISGNKYWKLFYNLNKYLENNTTPFIITFGGAYSNHIAAVAAFGRDHDLPTMGIIRGEELQQKFSTNPTLRHAHDNGMQLKFVSRQLYRDKDTLASLLNEKYPQALVIPEGGTNRLAVEGIRHMLAEETKEFHYLCSAVGTGGTLAGLRKFAQPHQRVLGFTVVRDTSLFDRVSTLSGSEDFQCFEASFGGYGKISDEVVRFINDFWKRYKIPLDPIYTGKTMLRLFQLIEEGYFTPKDKILVFHTGGLQGIEGANRYLKDKNRDIIAFI